jgi:hypothetical protein
LQGSLIAQNDHPPRHPVTDDLLKSATKDTICTNGQFQLSVLGDVTSYTRDLAILERRTVASLINKYIFYRIQIFITVLTKASH